MYAESKIASQLMANLFTLLILLMLVGVYGKQVIEWVLLKLYHFFIGIRE